jgi:excisionase family DNA binding protein
MQKESKPEQLVTFKEFCSICNITEARGRTAISKKELKFLRLGRLIRFELKDIQDWISKNKEVASE